MLASWISKCICFGGHSEVDTGSGFCASVTQLCSGASTLSKCNRPLCRYSSNYTSRRVSQLLKPIPPLGLPCKALDILEKKSPTSLAPCLPTHPGLRSLPTRNLTCYHLEHAAGLLIYHALEKPPQAAEGHARSIFWQKWVDLLPETVHLKAKLLHD